MAENAFTAEWHARHLAKVDGAKQKIVATAPQVIAQRPRKYRNTPTVRDGITFDSAKEASRYSELALLEKLGAIRNLVCQPRYELLASDGEVIGHMTPDFSYWSLEHNRQICEDVKSPITRKETSYRLRKKLFPSSTGLFLTEV